MADHVRKQIRDALAAALTGMATASTVFVGRVHPLETDDVPAVNVMTEAEEISIDSKGGKLSRDLSAAVEGHAMAAAGLIDILDAIAKEVEAAVAAAGDLGGLVKAITLESTEVDMTGDGQQSAGFVRLVYAINYVTSEAAPDVAL